MLINQAGQNGKFFFGILRSVFIIIFVILTLGHSFTWYIVVYVAWINLCGRK